LASFSEIGGGIGGGIVSGTQFKKYQ